MFLFMPTETTPFNFQRGPGLKDQLYKGDNQDTCMKKLSLRYEDIPLTEKVPKEDLCLLGMKKVLGGKIIY